MSKYSIDFDPGDDDRLPEWLVCRDDYTVRQVTVSTILFHSPCKEEAETMLEEYRILEQAAEQERFNNQQSEFDMYGDNAMEFDYV